MKKKIYKVLSVLLTLLIVFSACSCIFGTVTAAETKYYVRSTGDDINNAGTSQSKPLKTVGGVITKAVAAGLGTGDTVIVNLIGETPILWLESGTDLPQHAFKLILKSNSSTVLGTIGNGTSVALGGDTEFTNIKINFGSSYNYLNADGNSVTFGNGVEYVGEKNMSGFALGSTVNNESLDKDFTVDTSLAITDFVLGGKTGTSPTFNGDVNVVYNATAGTPKFDFGAANVAYNRALNIELKALASVSFANAANAVFGTYGYVQIMNHVNTSINASELNMDAAHLWVINNTLKSAGLISTTDTKGKFAVDTAGYTNIKAENAADPSDIVEPVEGFLTLPAGIWNITAQKQAAQGTYYVEANGSGDGSAEDKPLSSVGAAVEAAVADGYIAGDEVTVKVIGTERAPLNKLTAENSPITMPRYEFKLIVTSNVGNEATVGSGRGDHLNGETVFKNIKIFFGGTNNETGSIYNDYWKNFTCRGNNVTFGEGCSYAGNGSVSHFAIGYSSGTNEINNDFTISSTIGITNYYIAQDYHSATYNGNVNIIYDYSSGTPKFDIGTHASSDTSTTYYNKALNINLKSATRASFGNAGEVAFGENGYMQILNSSATPIIPADAGLTGAAYDGKLWVLNNDSGKVDVVDVSDTKGKFKVKLDDPEHKLIAENVDTGVPTIYDGADGVEGFITLDAGTYKLTIDRAPIYAYYYTDPDNGIEIPAGSRPDGAGEKANPVKTYSDAMRLIVADGLTTGDFATIYLPSDQEISWGTNTPATKATVTLTSTAENIAKLVKSGGNANLTADKTIFENISMTVQGQYDEFHTNEKNFVLGSTSTVNAHKFYLWATASGKKRVDDVDVVIQGTVNAGNIRVFAPYHRHESTGNINITWDSPTPFGIEFGNERDHYDEANVYSGNINLTIKQAQAFALITNNGGGAKFAGTFNIIIDGDIKLPYNVTKNFHNLTVDGGKWYITNAASDSEFISFTKDKGKFAIKNGATAYGRQGSSKVVTYNGGTVDLSAASGMYTISDKADVPVIEDSPYKMLYYKLGGGHKHIAQWCTLYDEVTYVYEFTMFSHAYNLTKPIVYEDNRYSVLDDDGKIVSDTLIGFGTKLKYLRENAKLTQEELAKKAGVSKALIAQYEGQEVAPLDKEGKPDAAKLDSIASALSVTSEALGGNFHRVVWEFTIPKGVNEAEGSSLFVGNSIPSHDEGLIMDRTVYRKDDATKTDLFNSNQNFGDGLDYVTLNYEFWGRVFSGATGGTGLVEWTDGYQELKIMNKDYNYADYLIYLNNPQDGKWWNDKDIIEEEAFATYAKALGKFVDQNGDGVKGIEFLLKSDEASYKAKTNSKGKFDFGKILTGFYDLFIINGDEQIHTGFTSYISQDDVVEFNITTDTSGLVPEDTNQGNDYVEDTDEEVVEEIGPSGNLKGTVYTPKREIVKGLKVVLKGVGEAITDENGTFGFADIPVGEYELCAVNSDGSEYVFRTVQIKESVNLDVKLKYDPPVPSNADNTDNGWILWVIIASAVALAVVAALVFFLIIKKKKA